MRCILSVLSIVVAFSWSARQSGAVPIDLTNPSFEDPAGPKTVGDGTWSNIPGWTSTGPSSDSGIELFTPAPQPDLGANIAFLQSGDGAIFQTTNYTIETGDSFGLTFYERNDFQATELTVRFYYDDGTRNVFDTQTVTLTDVGREGPLTLRTLSTTATAPAVGNLLGVEFENTSGGSGQWGWVDLISLQTVGGPGDVNDDGSVDTIDYGIIRDHFRMEVDDRALGDLDLNGVVDFLDFIEWRENATPAALAELGFTVPEPTGLFLAVTGCALGLGKCRRRPRDR